MKIEIEKYIVNNYYELLKITKKITKNNDWHKDLLHDVIRQLYEKKEIKLKSLQETDIKYYIIKCLTINWFSKTSPFYRKLRMESSLYNELNTLADIAIDNDFFDDHMVLDIIENEWVEMDFFHKKIFEKYLTLGSLKKVSKDTTIPITSIARYVKETKTIIKQNTFRKLDND